MVSKRQREARKRFREANPHLFLKPEPAATASDTKKKKKKSKYGKKTKKSDTSSGTEAALKVRSDGGVTKEKKKKNSLKKHPLRVPGMKPGESCFICKAADHIAKTCPRKSEWERKKICLHCRQRGHILKKCPQKGEEEGDKKHCYNCGEAGHSLSNCRQPLQYGGTKFANCFICNEQGHLSKNCSKNTHGIYPKGGSCKVCGELTHLAKNCPNKGRKSAAFSAESKQAEKWRGKLTVFCSGDDLEDDFTVGSEKNGKKAKTSQSIANSDSFLSEIEAAGNKKAKKQSGPKIVNFVR